MADVICNNPTSLRSCILYEFLKGEKPFETHRSMMKMFGDEFMEYPEFEFWFMRFAQGNFDLDYDISLEPKKRQITDLPVDVFEKVGDLVTLQNDRFHHQQPQLMKTLGDEFMTYPEFEFWYMRFAQGNFDLDYDISLEPKKRQITDLPVDIFEKIGDSLYFEDRNHLRNVSKDIQFLVDNWNPKVTEFTYCNFDDWEIVQNSKTYGFCQFGDRMRPNPLGAAVRILKNPKLRFKELSVRQDAKWMKIEEELRKSSTKLHVVDFTLLMIPKSPIDLRLFCLGCLEEVTLTLDGEAVKRINEIVNPEHCKQLKMLTIETDRCPSDFPPNSFVGYPRFTIECYEGYCAKRVAEFIKKLMICTQLKLCILECVPSSSEYHANWEPIKEYLSDKDTLVPDFPNIRRYPIRGSTDFYEIDIEAECISIERKS